MSDVTKTLREVLIAEVQDGYGSPVEVNLTAAIDELSRSVRKIATSIIPPDACPAHDNEGVYVDSLTEAVMGMSKGLSRLADAMESIATSVSQFVNRD